MRRLSAALPAGLLFFFMQGGQGGQGGQGVALARQQPGAPAQDFSLPTLAGGTVQLQALRGKVVVLDFWATWCEPCMRELPELEKLAQQLSARGVVVLGVTVDQRLQDARQTAGRLKLSAVQVAHDATSKVAERYDPPKMPTSYVIDRAGQVRFIHPGYDGAADIARLRREIEGLLK